jgi:Ca2+-binding EF-hand superfamily protein
LETVERDFAPQGVKFYYIYKALAHPETNGYITPFTLQERLMHVAEAKKKLGSRITWLCDTMSNDAKHTLGNAPNSEFIVDRDGKVVVARRWSKPDELRTDLEELVGEVENPTTIADIGMKRLEPPKTAPKGVVARLRLPGRMNPLKVQASTDSSLSGLSLDVAIGGEPLYVKLRAEVDSAYFEEGSGQLYLGFFLDPLYEVHWNNQVAPVAYEIVAPEGVAVTPLKGTGPKVEEKADADPREFLVDLSGESDEPIKLSVKYFACDDAETFCKPVTQHYLISLERDRDGGSRRGSGRRPSGLAGGPASRDSASTTEKRSKNLRDAVAVFRKHDTNEDGKLDKDEWANVEKAPNNTDADEDGVVSLRELLDAINKQTARTAPGRTAPQDPLFAALDADGDGTLTKDELAAAPRALRKLDKNDDGRLTSNEFAAAPSRRPPFGFGGRGAPGGRQSPAEMLARMDANGDGKISKDELPERMRERWDRMDTNGDGFVDKKEQQAIAARIQRGFRGQ